jgi:hypothetical protein
LCRISTNVPGIHVADQMPLFAKLADKTAIIRSLSHESNEHEPSVYRTLTGRINASLRVPRNDRNRRDAPTVGSVVSYFHPGRELPATVTIPRPIGHEGVTYSGTYAGFLGARYDPMEVKAAGESKAAAAHPLTLPPDIDEARLLARRGLLQTIEDADRHLQSQQAARDLDGFRQQAFGMLSSPIAKRALNIDHEDDKTRDRYGRNEWGESILTARRLVEAGVRLVTISWMYIQKDGNVSNVWDNHGGLEGKNGYEMLKAEYCLPSLDRDSAYPTSDRVSPEDMLATIYHALGISPDADMHDHLGRPHRVVDGKPLTALF